MHVLILLAPTDALQVPAAHDWHAVSLFAEGVELHEPATHCVHTLDPAALQEPAEQP